MPILANLVVGIDGATTINGKSAPLSSGSDRSRFHAIRERADLIVIGGMTSRSEPYAKTPTPLVVITHSLDLPGSAADNPDAIASNSGIVETINNLRAIYTTVLIEAGATLVHGALEVKLIDELYLTVTELHGEGPYLELSPELLRKSELTLVSEDRAKNGKELYRCYARLPSI